MVDIAVASPADTDVVANFPADERGSRAALLALTTGLMTFGGTSGGSANAHTLTIANTGWVLTNKPQIEFIAGFTNTSTTPSMTVNGGDTDTIVSPTGGALVAGNITAGTMYRMRFDGTNWRLANPSNMGEMSQALYDIVFPVNKATQFTATTDTPAVPTGVTATWTRDTTANYIRVASGTPGSGGSLNTSTQAEAEVETDTPTQSSFSGAGGGGASYPRPNHTHNVTIPAITLTIEPSYTSLCKWLRTA